MLLKLLDAEQADRHARSLRYQMKSARFPHHRDLTNFEWQESQLLAEHVAQLASGEYLESARNLILVGGTGKGKTHLATALGRSSHHYIP